MHERRQRRRVRPAPPSTLQRRRHATICDDVPDSLPTPTPVLLGYGDRFSVAPGETIRFMVSCEADSFRAQLVRLIHGDANPAGPAYKDVQLPSHIDRTLPGRR